MTQMMIERFLLSAVIFLLLFVGVKMYRLWMQRKLRLGSRKNAFPLNIKKGNPVALYFWAPDCTQCKPQEKQLEQATSILKNSEITLDVLKFNAVQEKALSKYFGVMTVPTIIMLDSTATITNWNPGFTKFQEIIEQCISMKEKSRARSFEYILGK